MADIAAWAELLKTLGIAAPLVGFLIFIYNKTDSERRETQSKFLDALQNAFIQAAADRQSNTAALMELTATIRERGTASMAEHEKMLMIMQKMADKLEKSEKGN